MEILKRMPPIQNHEHCDKCKDFYQFKENKPQEIVASSSRQTALFQCPSCGAFWEEGQRYCVFLSKNEVAKYYGSQYVDKVN